MENLLRGAFPIDPILRMETVRRAAARSKLYIVYLTPRSGSTWLTDLAANSGVLGVPQEWFNHSWIYTKDIILDCHPPLLRGTLDINAYIDAIVDESKGVTGLELSTYQALMLCDLLDESFDSALLSASFYLRRRDIIAQAVSLYRSVKSNVFHSFQGRPSDTVAFQSVEYDYAGIVDSLNIVLDCEARFEEMFANYGTVPVRIFYEDLVDNPLGVLNLLATHLCQPIMKKLPISSVTLMRDARNRQWARRFEEEMPEGLRAALKQRAARLEME